MEMHLVLSDPVSSIVVGDPLLLCLFFFANNVEDFIFLNTKMDNTLVLMIPLELTNAHY